MPADDRFAERLARIEHRAKTGQKAEYAPLPEHPDEKKKTKRSSLGGTLFSWIILPLVAATVFAGVFANELSDVLPPEFVTASNQVSDMILSKINSVGSSQASPVPDATVPAAQATESEVSRILLGQ